MKKSTIVILVVSLALLVTLFAMLFMGLNGGPTVVPRSPL